MVIDVRRNAISYIINIDNAAVGNTGGRKNMPPDQSFDNIFEQRWNRIHFFFANYTWGVPFSILLTTIQEYQYSFRHNPTIIYEKQSQKKKRKRNMLFAANTTA